jgi:hypothetical protein
MPLPILHQRGHGLWIKSVMLTNSPHRYQILYKDNSFITLKLVIYSRGKKKRITSGSLSTITIRQLSPSFYFYVIKIFKKKLIFLFFSLFFINFFIFSYCFNILILKINIVLIYFQVKINLKNNHQNKYRPKICLSITPFSIFVRELI